MIAAPHIRPQPEPGPAGTPLEETLAAVSAPGAFPGWPSVAGRHETHMSWIFFAGDRVYKLKKPVRLAYLDFSTLARRRAACEAEYRLNQALAPGIYLGVAPLVRTSEGLSFEAAGEVVDWFVVMQRLDLSRTLEARLLADGIARGELDALAEALARFYRHARRSRRAPAAELADWRALMSFNRRILLDPALGMPAGAVRRALAVQARFLRRRADLIAQRVRTRQIVDAHGDLRPEHIWMGPPIRIIDRLEFSAALRCVDWLDELAFLQVETERLGADWVGAYVRGRVSARLRAPAPEALRLFYGSARALLRARLAIAHLSEPNPRTPEKWPRQARAYLAIALRDARRLERLLSRPSDPSAAGRPPAWRSPRRAAGPPGRR